MDYNVVLKKAARKYGKKPIKIFWDRDLQLSFADVANKSLDMALWLREKGLKKGDRFAIWMGNVPEFSILLAASLRLGAVLVPVSIYEPMDRVVEICRECGCKFLFIDPENKYIAGQLEKGIPEMETVAILLTGKTSSDFYRFDFLPQISASEELLCPMDMEDVVLIAYTSGSTGERKGIQKTIKSYLGAKVLAGASQALDMVNRVYKVSLLNLCPWYHNTGLHLQMVAMAGVYFLEITSERFNPTQILPCIREHNPHIFLGTATMLYRCCMMEEAENIRFPAFIFSSGEALHRHVMEKLESCKGTGILNNGYGTTETGGITTMFYQFRKTPLGIRLLMRCVQAAGFAQKIYHMEDFSSQSRGSVLGQVLQHVDLLIYDDKNHCALPEGQVGEICATSSTAMKGYLGENQSDVCVQYQGKTYFRSGDLGYLQGDLLYLAGRKKNIIIRSGENILPSDLEGIALEQPGVLGAVACGTPSAAYGEDICLCLEAKQDAVDLGELETQLRSRLPKYMYPQNILFWDSFPVNSSGKVDMLQIRQEATSRTASNNNIAKPKKYEKDD